MTEDQNPDRTPPHDLAAERAVIGCTLLEPRALLDAGELQPDDFFLPQHREAWDAIQAVAAQHKPVDILTVGAELQTRGCDGRFEGGWGVWAPTISAYVPTVHNLAHYANIIREKSSLRRMIALCSDVLCRCYGGAAAGEVVAEARDGMAEIEAFSEQAGPVKIADSLGVALEVITQRSDPTKPSRLVKTGIEVFDRVIGGLAEEEVIIVAGRPGKGKTSYANGVAMHAAEHQGIPTCVISIEMSQQQEIERLLSMESGVPAAYLRSGRDGTGNPLGIEYHRKLLDAGGRMSLIPLWVDSRPLTLGQLINTIRRWHAREVAGKGLHLGLVIIDYIQLIGVETKGRESSREQQVARISKSMKWLAKQIHCPIMVLCQLNREIEKRGGDPRLSDLRESGAIEQDADIVLFVDRDSTEEDAVNVDCNGNLIVGKNRNGPIGKFGTWWKAQTMRFVSRDEHHLDDQGQDTRGPHWAEGREPQ